VSTFAEHLNQVCKIRACSKSLSDHVRVHTTNVSASPVGILNINIDAGCFEDHFTWWGWKPGTMKGRFLQLQQRGRMWQRLQFCRRLWDCDGVSGWCLHKICKMFVNCVFGKTKLEYKDIVVQNCLKLLFSMSNVSLIYVKRCNNRIAHSFVGIARKCGTLYSLVSLITQLRCWYNLCCCGLIKTKRNKYQILRH